MRVAFIDTLRGLSILMMITFHGAYDLNLFGILDLNFKTGFWFYFPRFTAFCFLLIVGISLKTLELNGKLFSNFKKRLLKLFVSSLSVSFGTFFLFPNDWVYFGTLHCIFFGTIFGTLLVERHLLRRTLLMGILFLQYVAGFDLKWVSFILQKPSMDLIPIYPWLWVILLGIEIGPWFWKQCHFKGLKPLNFLGQNSLVIYLIHQPILFSLTYLLSKIV